MTPRDREYLLDRLERAIKAMQRLHDATRDGVREYGEASLIVMNARSAMSDASAALYTISPDTIEIIIPPEPPKDPTEKIDAIAQKIDLLCDRIDQIQERIDKIGSAGARAGFE